MIRVDKAQTLTVINRPLSNGLMKPGFRVFLSHRRNTTVSSTKTLLCVGYCNSFLIVLSQSSPSFLFPDGKNILNFHIF